MLCIFLLLCFTSGFFWIPQTPTFFLWSLSDPLCVVSAGPLLLSPSPPPGGGWGGAKVFRPRGPRWGPSRKVLVQNHPAFGRRKIGETKGAPNNPHLPPCPPHPGRVTV